MIIWKLAKIGERSNLLIKSMNSQMLRNIREFLQLSGGYWSFVRLLENNCQPFKPIRPGVWQCEDISSDPASAVSIVHFLAKAMQNTCYAYIRCYDHRKVMQEFSMVKSGGRELSLWVWFEVIATYRNSNKPVVIFDHIQRLIWNC